MKCFCDLHIHSALSPCGDEEMTPNNIVNMSVIKGLDFIAITDHNASLNVKACMEVAKDKIIVVPGIEVCTAEDIHVICLFMDLDKCLDFSKTIYESLIVDNVAEIFGNQTVLNSKDEKVGELDKLLIAASAYSIDEICEMTLALDGVFIPAHIYRPSNSIIATLGSIPKELPVNYVEAKEFKDNTLKYIKTSDAHRLEDILEKEFSFDLKKKTIECLFKKIRIVNY